MLKALKILGYALWNAWFYVLAFVGIIICLPFFIVFSTRESWYPYFFWFARNVWANIILYGMGFWPKVYKESSLKKGASYMWVANHTSMIDIMLLLKVSSTPFVFVGKKELVKMPLFGYFYKRVCIMVDRSSPRSRRNVYVRAQKRLDTGLGIGIYPEGLVPHPSVHLAPFKDGAFRLAIQYQIPIVPVSFMDCKRRFPFQFQYKYFVGGPGLLRAHIHKPIETLGLTNDSKEVLKKQVYELLEQKLQEVN